MISNKIQELEQYKAKLAQMEKSVMAERDAQLKRLHLDMGFATRAELISALRKAGAAPAVAKRGRRKKKAAVAVVAEAAAPAKKGRRKRAKITPELRQKIIDAVKAGGTGGAVAKKFGVSLPTVQNIKKAAGLVKSAAAAPAS